MSEERCKNCRHWAKVEPIEPDQDYQSETEKLALRHGYGRCNRVVDGSQFFHALEASDGVLDETLACTVDGEGYRSEFLTGPEFHCGKFKAKE